MPPQPARNRAATAFALAASGALAACAPLSPVARYPWVEDPDLELAAERLSIEVSGREAHVDAVFRFRSHGAPET